MVVCTYFDLPLYIAAGMGFDFIKHGVREAVGHSDGGFTSYGRERRMSRIYWGIEVESGWEIRRLEVVVEHLSCV
jgi:hypothetical protein